MSYRNVLITGGAGFVGSNLALLLKRHRFAANVIALDNLRRRGSELALARLRAARVSFVHGDVRNRSDVAAVGPIDLLIDSSAEPSVMAGYGESPEYLLQTNLVGTINCLEHARLHGADVFFLSTSRVYPLDALRSLPLETKPTRLDIANDQSGPGWSQAGIGLEFPLKGARSLYGATKLASELLLDEYHRAYGMRTIVNRCGVLTGPWQMGKVDQGFVVLWAAQHAYGGSLRYIGFGGQGLQVRDILHVDDLYDLLVLQLAEIDRFAGSTFNVGGGRKNSLSLAELTDHCRRGSERSPAITADLSTRTADVPWYISDNSLVTQATGWEPRRSVEDILSELFVWLRKNRQELKPILLA